MDSASTSVTPEHTVKLLIPPVTYVSSDEQQYPPLVKQITITFALGIALLLVGLDSTITSTAVPTITDQFQSAKDIGWYTSAYLLTTSASQLYYGKLYSGFNPKPILFTCIIIFGCGSLLSGLAPNSIAFIIGRAICGLGRAGIISGALSIAKDSVPRQRRPLAGIVVGSVETIAVVSAPLLGGVLTDKVSWRWCFLINPPLAAAVLLILFFLLPDRPHGPISPNNSCRASPQKLWKSLDNAGALLIAVSVICLLLPLQWAGIEYTWNDYRVIVPLTLSGVTFIAFLYVEHFRGVEAVFPLSLFGSRTVSMSALFGFFLNAAFVVVENYLPIWFQLIKHASPISSGLMLLPAILSMLVGVALSGIGTSVFGYYVPFMLASSVVLSIAIGLLTTLRVNAGRSTWIGFQVVFGIGVGLGLQQPYTAAQSFTQEREGKDVATVSAIILFVQTLGGTLGASIAQNILLKQLTLSLPAIDPSLTPARIKNTGLTDLVRDEPAVTLAALLPEINRAITQVFYVALVCACLSLPASMFTKWKSVKTKQPDGAANTNIEAGVEKDSKSSAVSDSTEPTTDHVTNEETTQSVQMSSANGSLHS